MRKLVPSGQHAHIGFSIALPDGTNPPTALIHLNSFAGYRYAGGRSTTRHHPVDVFAGLWVDPPGLLCGVFRAAGLAEDQVTVLAGGGYAVVEVMATVAL